MNVIVGSYNQRLANRFSRKIRRVLMDDAFSAETQRKFKQDEQDIQDQKTKTIRLEFDLSCPSCPSC